MKISNKLLLGLFVVVVVCVFIANFIIKKEFDNKLKSDVKIESNTNDSTLTIESDSIAMDSAIQNQ